MQKYGILYSDKVFCAFTVPPFFVLIHCFLYIIYSFAVLIRNFCKRKRENWIDICIIICYNYGHNFVVSSVPTHSFFMLWIETAALYKVSEQLYSNVQQVCVRRRHAGGCSACYFIVWWRER